jgi:sigma-B regulation protein RsbU (phosphoserine phosphatase)
MKTKDVASKSFWRRMPARSTSLFLLTVFFIFAPIGFIWDIWAGGGLSIERVWLNVLYSGVVSIGYAFSFTRSFKILPLVIVFQCLIFDGAGIMVCIIVAYIIFINFITKEGIKQIELSKEMELAGEIHRVLVPDLDTNNNRFEITGRSNPTDEVGGDLIDMISHQNETIVYMIDVSGHGVGPGLLTGMFKASFRSIYEKGKTLHTIVNNLNKILLDQRKKGLFITFGGLRFHDDDHIEMLLAGHPPMIHIDKDGKFEELKITQLPLLTLRNVEYDKLIVNSKPGDLFIIYSDGIIETSNKKREQFGFERFQKILLTSCKLPTGEISEKVYDELNAYGSSQDDQSLIVIRKK